MVSHPVGAVGSDQRPGCQLNDDQGLRSRCRPDYADGHALSRPQAH
jgi:hypothetical protein